MSDLNRNEQTRPAEATDGGLIRLGCCYCDRTDCDGISAFPTDWRHIQQVKVQGLGIWETHLGVCPECQKFEDDDVAGIDTGSPPWEEREAEFEEPVSIHPIVRQIIDRDCHVSESNKDVVRHVISKLHDGYQSLRKMPAHDRRMLVEQCVAHHRSNFKEYVEVMSGFTHTIGQDPSTIGLPSSLTGKEVVALMRKHKVTIESLAFRIGTSMKRIRKIRESGLQDALAVRDWIQAITGEDPGPIPEKYRVNNRQAEGSCCFCGYPLYIDDSAYEYVGRCGKRVLLCQLLPKKQRLVEITGKQLACPTRGSFPAMHAT